MMFPVKDDIKTIKKVLRRHPRRTLFGALVISLLCIAIALVHMFYVPTPRRFVRTTGTVTGVNIAVDSSTSQLGYYAVVQHSVNGKTYTFNGRAHAAAIHKKGDRITIAYFPANPYVGRDLSDHPATTIDKALLGLGGVGLVFVAAWLFKVWWRAEDVPQDAEDIAIEQEDAQAVESDRHKRSTRLSRR